MRGAAWSGTSACIGQTSGQETQAPPYPSIAVASGAPMNMASDGAIAAIMDCPAVEAADIEPIAGIRPIRG